MAMATNPFNGLYELSPEYPRGFNSSLSFITPFTHRTNISYAELLFELYKWLREKHLPELDNFIQEFKDKYEEDHAALLEEISKAKNEWQEFFNLFIEQVIEELQGLNDQAVANLILDELSATRQALKDSDLFVPIYNDVVKIGVTAGQDHTDTTRGFVAIGRNAGQNMVDADKSVAIGTNAMRDGMHSLDNVAIGDNAMRTVDAFNSDYSQSQQGGTRNVGIGGNAGLFVDKGYAHTFVGRNAGQNTAGGTGAVAIGNGAQAGRCPVGLSGTIENWAPLAQGLSSGVNVVSVGNWAGSRNTALEITALGSYALTNSVKSDKNVAVGSSALRRVDEDKWLNGRPYVPTPLNGTYEHNGNNLVLSFEQNHGAIAGDVAIFQLLTGGSATFSTDQVFGNVISVQSAGIMTILHPREMNSSGTVKLVAIAKSTGAVSYCDENTAVGSASMAFFNGGNANTALGSQAGRNIKKGGANTFIGQNAGAGISESAVISASDNTAVGQASLFKLSDGMSGHTAVGYRAGLNLVSGADNTFIGRGAGQVGFDGETPLTTATRSTALGASASVSGDHQIQLGTIDETTYAYGAIQERSDKRDKANIEPTKLGLGFIEALNPVDFNWNYRGGSGVRNRKHHGLIAQDVKKVIDETGLDFGGFQDHSINGGDDVLTIGYTELIAPLIKAVQELSAKVKELESK